VLDGDGKVLSHSGDRETNTGFPFEDDEIERFAGMLKAGRLHLTDGEIGALSASLRANAAAEKAKRGK
jgi:hypothetical protein